jgi:itaconyl-CoA hydratase
MTSGPFFEDFEVGATFEHGVGRTVSDADNTWFTLLTCNTNQIHFNHDLAAKSAYGKPVVNSCLSLAIVTGLSTRDISQNGINLGWEDVKLVDPVFAGDTIYARSEIVHLRRSRSKPDHGIVGVRTAGYTQRGPVFMEYTRSVLVPARSA